TTSPHERGRDQNAGRPCQESGLAAQETRRAILRCLVTSSRETTSSYIMESCDRTCTTRHCTGALPSRTERTNESGVTDLATGVPMMKAHVVSVSVLLPLPVVQRHETDPRHHPAGQARGGEGSAQQGRGLPPDHRGRAGVRETERALGGLPRSRT